ncbi:MULTISPECIES: DUF742 domain-containing protein [Streptomyces]|uniref:DUF742 domain-containing protein n=1 Tax=Streptomyces doudnae TaxID=3075536 RepID=A0ABD5F1J0_9ACTN|nr:MULTISPECIES: DUF742 domain-containing protein [unclassified Streptomyces]MDT0439985.1 DUF742 domain-containing protein [Streptomyces sp. DSM 41981]MYQ62314.1 DUF742 domain-containing protein [Streptomyces sp. SID4950]SCD34901.1 Protein of unknown function [Streptomyces sp. SolWspMP-5a-2]
MSTLGRAAEQSAFVRTYTVVRGRTKPRHLLGLETVLEAGQGRPGPAQAEECEEILALCRERRRSVVELAGRLGRPVTAVKILVSDLLDANALAVPLTDPYAGTGQGSGPSTQLLEALSAGLRRKWPDAVAKWPDAVTYPEAG